MAGRACGVFAGLDAFAALPAREALYRPAMGRDTRERLLAGWRDAVARTLHRPRLTEPLQ